MLQNSATAGSFRVAGFGLTSVSGSVKLGTITLTKSTTTTPLNVGLVSGEYGSRTASPLSLGFYTDDTEADGVFLMGVDAGSYTMNASRAVTDIGRAVTAADALAALRLAVGLNPNTDPDGTGPLLPLRVSPYQFMAADVTGDGRVSSADALAILKMAVRAADAPTARWTFLDATDTYWDANASAFTVTRTNVPSPQPIVVDVSQGVRQDLVGLVSGDVNGSWRPLDANGNALADGSYPAVADAYLIGQATALGVPTDLWGL